MTLHFRRASRPSAADLAARSRASSTVISFTPVDEIATRVDALQPALHALELEAGAVGAPLATLYLGSARASLSHVARCLAKHASTTCEDLGIVDPDVRLVPLAEMPGVGSRQRRSGGRWLDDDDADLPAWSAVPDLGADLLRSRETAAICAGPIGAHLLFCALAHQRWLHLATGARWSTDAGGARALVGAIADGAGFPACGPGVRAGLIDARVLSHFKSLGWSRLISPEMPGAT